MVIMVSRFSVERHILLAKVSRMLKKFGIKSIPRKYILHFPACPPVFAVVRERPPQIGKGVECTAPAEPVFPERTEAVDAEPEIHIMLVGNQNYTPGNKQVLDPAKQRIRIFVMAMVK
jgi:hypothetical protein